MDISRKHNVPLVNDYTGYKNDVFQLFNNHFYLSLWSSCLVTYMCIIKCQFVIQFGNLFDSFCIVKIIIDMFIR